MNRYFSVLSKNVDRVRKWSFDGPSLFPSFFFKSPRIEILNQSNHLRTIRKKTLRAVKASFLMTFTLNICIILHGSTILAR